MSGLSEVSILLAQKANDIETAREIFKDEISAFVGSIVSGLRRARSDPWTSARIRLDVPREVETESKAVARIADHFAIGRVGVRFKKGTNFVQVAEIRFGFELEDPAPAYTWQVSFNLVSRYLRMDDLIWAAFRASNSDLPGQAHRDKTNTVVFSSRPVDSKLTAELAFSDIKTVMEFVLASETAVAEAVGIDPTPSDGS